jgi:hypothetical protein
MTLLTAAGLDSGGGGAARFDEVSSTSSTRTCSGESFLFFAISANDNATKYAEVKGSGQSTRYPNFTLGTGVQNGGYKSQKQCRVKHAAGKVHAQDEEEEKKRRTEEREQRLRSAE